MEESQGPVSPLPSPMPRLLDTLRWGQVSVGWAFEHGGIVV